MGPSAVCAGGTGHRVYRPARRLCIAASLKDASDAAASCASAATTGAGAAPTAAGSIHVCNRRRQSDTGEILRRRFFSLGIRRDSPRDLASTVTTASTQVRTCVEKILHLRRSAGRLASGRKGRFFLQGGVNANSNANANAAGAQGNPLHPCVYVCVSPRRAIVRVVSLRTVYQSKTASSSCISSSDAILSRKSQQTGHRRRQA